MDLFEYMGQKNKEKDSPLASRLRPETLDEVVGQKHILGKDKLLYRAIQADKLSSLIFYGPPGTGKTTLARVIANTTKANFRQINATSAGKKDMEAVVQEAKENLAMYGTRTILFIDEIHRFNKGQQDYLLPFVEDGTVILIGATTENPYFEVNRALISRSNIFELHPLSREDIEVILNRAVTDVKKGMGAYHAVLEDDARTFLADICDGDARNALNAVELAVLTTPPGEDGQIHITASVAEECIQRRNIRYDKDGDNHYDVISAFIKSMRGSDPDAAVYYLARMIYAGEDPRFIARRIMICASEDVGMADPQAICVASAAAQIVERVGMPEGRIPLAEAAIYVATAPKSNASYLAIDAALEAVRDTPVQRVPPHLQDSHYAGAKELGRGIGYQYAHDFPGHYVRQQYLPDELTGRRFFEPGENGYEKEIKKYMEFCKEL
ncbi:MAG: replication-associated recombination protein A [Lachnospiraceae bacterium]|nr:replication-associated recombination protein A [Lachnospiraceae bacterium]